MCVIRAEEMPPQREQRWIVAEAEPSVGSWEAAGHARDLGFRVPVLKVTNKARQEG